MRELDALGRYQLPGFVVGRDLERGSGWTIVRVLGRHRLKEESRFEIREVGREVRRQLSDFIERLLMLAGDQDISAHLGAIDHLEHWGDQARRDLLDFDHAANFGQCRWYVGEARNPDALVAEREARAVDGKHPAR